MKTNSIGVHPDIYANYFEDDEDMKTMVDGVKWRIELTEKQTFKHHDVELIHILISEVDKFEFKLDNYWR